jgi:dienelactone hydrolase
MKKILISVLVTVFLLVSNFGIPSTALSYDEKKGPPKPKEWKGEGTKIEFPSMPTMTIKDFLEGKKPERQITIWGTLKFPANAPNKNVPVVVIMHGMGGIGIWEEYWMNTFNSMGLATFMVDSNWARRNCKKDNKFKKAIPWCAAINRGMNRIIDGYGALQLLSKHPRIDSARIGCLGISLGARGCLYLNVKRFQKMWGTPGLEFAASVPMYPPCNVIFKEDDEITNTPIRIHIGELDTYLPADSCVDYGERLRAKGKDVEVKVYPNAHHGFDAKMVFHGGKTKNVIKGHNDGRCYYEENTELPVEHMKQDDVAILSQIGFNEWYASATKKEKKKVFRYINMRHKVGWRLPQFQFDKSCVSKSTTMEYNKEAAEEATKLVKDFFSKTLNK